MVSIAKWRGIAMGFMPATITWQANCSLALLHMKQIYGLSRRLWQKGFCRWLLAICFGGAIGVAMGHAVIVSISGSVSVVEGNSMAPTYQPGTRVYTAPISGDLVRGDIVLIDDGKSGYALKRIVGLPGETVQFWRGYVFINRKMLREPYLAKHTYTFPDEHNEISRFKVGEGQYFVLGDNRDYSVDSRLYGPVERDQIKSRVPFSGGPQACFAAYTLPVGGKRTIQPLFALPADNPRRSSLLQEN